ncbi:MAG: O-antigen ligase family protein [Bacteroidales bacterium]|nr:O-antigen ligase family protein [Bacteroidales bacterium]
MQKKLPLVLLPLGFTITEISENKKYRLYWFYLAGVLTVTLICLFYFIIRYFSDSHFHREILNFPFSMLYSRFYIFGNINYYVVYLSMAALLVIGIIFGPSGSGLGKAMKRWMYIGLFLFLAFAFLIPSRSGLMALVITLIFLGYYFCKSLCSRAIPLILLLLAGFYMTGNYRFDSYRQVFNRMIRSTEAADSEYLIEKNVLRPVFWKTSAKVIGEHLWFGVGTGDVKAQIKAKYKEMGVYDTLHENDDPHNQFLRTFVATGLLGFLMLLGAFWFGFVRGFQSKDYFLLAFLILIGIHLLFKSMLFREDGVIFFSFFYGLLYTANIRENSAI